MFLHPDHPRYYTNCIRLLRFVYLAQTTRGSLKRSLGMARCSLCKAQHLITIGLIPLCAFLWLILLLKSLSSTAGNLRCASSPIHNCNCRLQTLSYELKNAQKSAKLLTFSQFLAFFLTLLRIFLQFLAFFLTFLAERCVFD